MSLPDLSGEFFPRSTSYFENRDYFLYKGESFNSHISIRNIGSESAEAFDVDLYISLDETIDESDYYLGTYNFVDGIPGRNLEALRVDNFSTMSLTLPEKESDFWREQEIYYLGAIIDPENNVIESNEDNNYGGSEKSFGFFNSSDSNPIRVKQADIPVVSFIQDENTINISLSEGLTNDSLQINYKKIMKEDYLDYYLNEIGDLSSYNGAFTRIYYGDRVYDSELNRLYVTGKNYHDLTTYNYYDTARGHYNPFRKKYFNADGSYYDVEKKLFYDLDRNVIELTDNSSEYEDPKFFP